MQLGMAAGAKPGGAAAARLSAISEQLHRVAQLTQDNPWQQKNVADFRRALDNGAQQGGQAVFAAGALEAANTIIDRMQREEYGLLLDRDRQQAEATRNAGMAIVALCTGLVILGILTSATARNEFRRRERVEAILRDEKQELTRRTEELAFITAGSEILQSVQDETRLNEAVANVLRKLVPASTGYFGLLDPKYDVIQVCQHWGDGAVPHDFQGASCAGLRLGRAIHHSQCTVQAGCGHVNPAAADYLCLPVRSANAHLGVIHIETATPLPRRCVDSIQLFAAHVALGLTNLRVRESLRIQSVRDSLTGLFNRRYFDETLQRELILFRRDGRAVSVLMLDVDYFKDFNDTHGHVAGDEALRALGHLMHSVFRESDVICRYGGEEFAIILAGADADEAFTRAETFRKRLEQAGVGVAAGGSRGITASIGVACSRDHATADQLVRGADAALYQAKRQGRNRTWMAAGPAHDFVMAKSSLPDASMLLVASNLPHAALLPRQPDSFPQG